MSWLVRRYSRRSYRRYGSNNSLDAGILLPFSCQRNRVYWLSLVTRWPLCRAGRGLPLRVACLLPCLVAAFILAPWRTMAITCLPLLPTTFACSYSLNGGVVWACHYSCSPTYHTCRCTTPPQHPTPLPTNGTLTRAKHTQEGKYAALSSWGECYG